MIEGRIHTISFSLSYFFKSFLAPTNHQFHHCSNLVPFLSHAPPVEKPCSKVLRGHYTLKLKLACFVCYLKFINTLKYICNLQQIVKGTQKWHWNFSSPSSFKLWIKIVFVKDSILGNWPKYECRRREKNRARSASTSAEGARVRRRRKASAASCARLSPEAQEIPRSGIESLLLWPNSYRLQVTLPVKIGYAPSRRSTDLLPKLTQHAAIL